MVFDALDGRLARFARHTTDFGGQLDSLADVVSFGAAPAFVALRLMKIEGPDLNVMITRLIWAAGAHVHTSARRFAWRDSMSAMSMASNIISVFLGPFPVASGSGRRRWRR